MNVAHKKKWQTFEIVFGIPFIAAIILQFIIPFPFSLNQWTLILLIIGIALIILGITLVIFARRELSKQNQPTDPGYPTSKLVTTGVYSVSRNPLYLGGICVIVGIALTFNIIWVLLFLIPSLIACHYILIIPEENYLSDKFEKRYQIYSNSVHRWLGCF